MDKTPAVHQAGYEQLPSLLCNLKWTVSIREGPRSVRKLILHYLSAEVQTPCRCLGYLPGAKATADTPLFTLISQIGLAPSGGVHRLHHAPRISKEFGEPFLGK